MDDPIIKDLLVSRSEVERATRVSFAVGRLKVPMLTIWLIVGRVSVLLVRVWVDVRPVRVSVEPGKVNTLAPRLTVQVL